MRIVNSCDYRKVRKENPDQKMKKGLMFFFTSLQVCQGDIEIRNRSGGVRETWAKLQGKFVL
jgi:hypothetical protein